MAASRFKVTVSNQQTEHEVPVRTLRSAVREVLSGEGIKSANISIAVVDDPTIHRLNKQFLKHDYPTDVLSFVLEHDDDHLDGEIVVSADTAAERCAEFGLTPDEELVVYVIHGTLHLVGYDDHAAKDRKLMRAKEKTYFEIIAPDTKP